MDPDARYSANGVQFYLVSLLSYLLLVYLQPDLPIQIYKNFAEIISSLNIFSLLFCVGLLIKGYYRPEVLIPVGNTNFSILSRLPKALWTNLCRISSMLASNSILECLVKMSALKKCKAASARAQLRCGHQAVDKLSGGDARLGNSLSQLCPRLKPGRRAGNTQDSKMSS